MKRILFMVSLVLITLSGTFAQSGWSFEFHGGEVYNVPMPLTISQQGFQDIKLSARFFSEPFKLPFYEDARLSRWQNGKSWEFEFLHHKLYLDNTTSEVQKFNISHGFNMLMVNRGFDRQKFHYRFGAGIVLTHPESKVRGKEFGDSTDNLDLGYFVSGPVINLSIGKHYRLNKRFFINTEAKTTLAFTSIKIADGNANVFNVAFHLILGVGYNFTKPSEN